MKEITIGWRIGGNHGDSTGPRDVGYRLRPGGKPGQLLRESKDIYNWVLPRSRPLLRGVVLALWLLCFEGWGT